MRLRVDAHSPIPIRWQLTEQLKHVIEGNGVPREQAWPSIAGGLPRHQSEHAGACDRGSEAERARGGAAGQGGCLWPPRSAPARSQLAARPF
jgi:hypothetical protein